MSQSKLDEIKFKIKQTFIFTTYNKWNNILLANLSLLTQRRITYNEFIDKMKEVRNLERMLNGMRVCTMIQKAA